jgi:hypothetical protein
MNLEFELTTYISDNKDLETLVGYLRFMVKNFSEYEEELLKIFSEAIDRNEEIDLTSSIAILRGTYLIKEELGKIWVDYRDLVEKKILDLNRDPKSYLMGL